MKEQTTVIGRHECETIHGIEKLTAACSADSYELASFNVYKRLYQKASTMSFLAANCEVAINEIVDWEFGCAVTDAECESCKKTLEAVCAMIESLGLGNMYRYKLAIKKAKKFIAECG